MKSELQEHRDKEEERELEELNSGQIGQESRRASTVQLKSIQDILNEREGYVYACTTDLEEPNFQLFNRHGSSRKVIFNPLFHKILDFLVSANEYI